MKILSFKQRLIRGSAWTFAGQGVNQVLRLASGIILRRWLFPQAFGLMAIVNVCIQGLKMFSDLGLGPSIVQNPRGEEPGFLRTAWTVQIIRGFVLWAIVLLLAWPASRFYDEPRLLFFLPAAAMASCIGGFSSTNLFLAKRKLELGKITVMETLSQTTALISVVIIAYFWRSTWALVVGGTIGAIIRTILTHLILKGPRMGFEFHRKTASELFKFGKWIFVATLLTFLLSRGDRLIMGKFMTMERLGIYSTALAFSLLTVELVNRLSSMVLFPAYAQMINKDPKQLRNKTFRIRCALIAALLPPTCLLVVIGPELISFLYDSRYHDAGWILQLLSIGAIFSVTLTPSSGVLLASGNSFKHMLLEMTKAFLLILFMCVGGYMGGESGLILGLVISRIAYYPALAILIRPYKVWMPWLDLAAFAAAGLLIAAGLWIKGLLL